MKELDEIVYNWSFALFDLADESKRLAKITNEVVEITKVLKENKTYTQLLNSYNVDITKKFAYIDQAFGNYDEYIVNIIKLIAKANIAKYLINIFIKFIELSNKKQNVRFGTVYTVKPLSKKDIEKFEIKLSKKLNAQVNLHNEIDENLICGIKIKVDDYIIENSIDDQLRKIKKFIK
ncbi:F0F1 ATP synthase subunit delta [[Mycoplasma] anseris]|uniref:ATP synthase subunit delta n=1 Tax=[Mycoplasma] anseris TaxID=92400 RepID=A0A2Z4NDS0_9BACT|nr:F0F1 ATP synthase subunit delta [[Mycoplasma] anseris]AWX69667.1 ATP synthase F1 subunit delta [[Mycoplasma] anseris]